MNNILKQDSFVNYKKIDIKIGPLDYEGISEEKTYKTFKILKKNVVKNINILSNNNYNNLSILEHQNFILDILIDLRDFDEKNGTELFKNISYNNLNTFILKNNL